MQADVRRLPDRMSIEPVALADFWSVDDGNCDPINEASRRLLADDGEFGPRSASQGHVGGHS